MLRRKRKNGRAGADRGQDRIIYLWPTLVVSCECFTLHILDGLYEDEGRDLSRVKKN